MLNIFRKNPDKLVRQRLIAATFSFLLLSLATSVEALQIIRGPYLQSGNTSGVTVMWRTDSNSNGVVNYGTDPTNLNFTAIQNVSNINHEVTITGLNSDTK